MEYWSYDGERHYKVGLNAVVGRPIEELSFEPSRFDEMRRGAWDIDARVHDMDLNGVYASLNFPSSLAGFAGQRYQLGVSDPDLALAVVRAANDWHLEEWAGTSPGRHHPVPGAVAARPRARRRARSGATRHAGFQAVTFPELPERLGLPSLHTGYWDPFLAACAETGTVVCLHVGSSSSAPIDVVRTRRPTPSACCSSAGRCSRRSTGSTRSVAVRFPDLRICLSEGGIGWVAGLLDRLDHVGRYQQMYGTWTGIDLTPAEVLQRNFWFCAIEDPSGARAAPPHRRRPHLPRVRLPAPGRHLARHPGDRARADRPLPGRRPAQAHVGERGAALPPPGARRGAGRPRRVLSWSTRAGASTVDEHDIRFRIAAARRMLYRAGLRQQRRRPRERARRRRRGRVLGHRPRVLRPDHARPSREARLRPRAARGRGDLLARGQLPRPHLRAASRRQRHRAPPLALRVGAVVDGSHGRHVQRARRCCSTTTRPPTSTTATVPHVDVADALGDKRVVLIKNHGAIVASQSIEDATIEAITLEKCGRATTSSARPSAAPRSPRTRCSAARRCTASTSSPPCGRRTSSAPAPLRPRPVRRARRCDVTDFGGPIRQFGFIVDDLDARDRAVGRARCRAVHGDARPEDGGVLVPRRVVGAGHLARARQLG